MKYTSFNYIPNVPVYFIPANTSVSPLPSSPIPYNSVSNENEERLIPFVGGALLGGIAGNVIGRQPYGYYPYPIYNSYYPYYPYGNYYTYGGGYIPSNYNYYYETPKTK